MRLGYSAIRAALDRFGGARPEILLVHSSLSACGQIKGGAGTVLAALRDWVSGGTLVMPSHSYCYPDEKGDEVYFDPLATPPEVGAIAHYFWQQPGVVRSVHPSHALACEGPKSREICVGHELCAAPCGPGSPYEQLIQRGASVLMFGVPMSCYTLYYSSEHAAGVPYVYYPQRFRLRVSQPSGEIREMVSWRHSSVPRRFEEVGQLMEAEGLIVRQPLGRGSLQFIRSAAAVHDWLLERLAQDPWLLAERVNAEA